MSVLLAAQEEAYFPYLEEGGLLGGRVGAGLVV